MADNVIPSGVILALAAGCSLKVCYSRKGTGTTFLRSSFFPVQTCPYHLPPEYVNERSEIGFKRKMDAGLANTH